MGDLQRLYRWLAQPDVERGNSQSTPPRVPSRGLAGTVAGVRAVQKMWYLRYVIYLSIVAVDSFETLRLMMKISQRACDMTYSTQIPSEISGMHYTIAMVMSETIASISSLPP